MYASSSPFASNGQRPMAGMYSQVGVETGVSAADPHKLVAMLFEGLLDAIAQARGAMKDGRVEAKGKAVSKAVRIIEEGLKGGLSVEGGDLAKDLSALYSYLVARLTYANLKNDDAALQECSTLIQPLRDAWMEIRAQVVTGPQA